MNVLFIYVFKVWDKPFFTRMTFTIINNKNIALRKSRLNIRERKKDQYIGNAHMTDDR